MTSHVSNIDTERIADGFLSRALCRLLYFIGVVVSNEIAQTTEYNGLMDLDHP